MNSFLHPLSSFPRKKLVTIGLLFLCVLLSLAFSQAFRYNFTEGLETKSYMDELTDHLNTIEDAIQKDERTTNQTKYDEVYGLIKKIPDSDTYTYKTDLLDIMKKKQKEEEEDAIYKKLMDKIKADRVQMINDKVDDSKAQVEKASNDPETQKLQKT